MMKSDELRSHRLNYLLKFHLENKNESALFTRSKEMGISNETARDYCRTVIIQYNKMEIKNESR